MITRNVASHTNSVQDVAKKEAIEKSSVSIDYSGWSKVLDRLKLA